jgi:ABC-type antimicrobial peptide transport system permease subunit
MVFAGLGAGAVLVFWARPLAARVLPDLKWEGEAPLAIGASALIAIASLASYGPARRAARVDPIVALRQD